MEVTRGHDRVEEAREAEEEIPLEAEEDLAARDNLGNSETEAKVLKLNQIHPSDHNRLTILATIPMLILKIADLRLCLLTQSDQELDKTISQIIEGSKDQRLNLLMET